MCLVVKRVYWVCLVVKRVCWVCFIGLIGVLDVEWLRWFVFIGSKGCVGCI